MKRIIINNQGSIRNVKQQEEIPESDKKRMETYAGTVYDIYNDFVRGSAS